jgi:hypothetical protein
MTKWIFTVTMIAFAFDAARADDAPIDKLYGAGVHAYFAGDSAGAKKSLDASIAAGNRDPRCYYYRGLASLRTGNVDAARADFREGATLEAQSPDLTTLVNRSIQRIQGNTRLSLERFRADAQLAAATARKARDAARYGASRASAIQELEKQAAPPTAGASLVPETKTGDAAAAGATAPAVDATQEKPAADPFGDEAATADPAATDPAAADPAATDPTAPKEEMPAEEKPAAEPPVADPAAEPKAEEPKTEEPAIEPPAADAPKAEEPKAEEPKAEEPTTEEPATDPPAGEAPAAAP